MTEKDAALTREGDAGDLRYAHTPGPWTFPEDSFSEIVEAARPHMRIAFLPSDWSKYASSEANARLIAAAPDMLAALKNIDHWLLVISSAVRADAPKDYDGVSAALKEVIAALEKARGPP